MKKVVDPCKKLDSAGRRKAVKKIVGGVTALAAYNMLPVRWETPIIEQVFLPAHAQTSGVASPYTLHDPCILTLISGNQNSTQAKVQVDGFVTPPTANLPTTITATPEGGTGGAVTFNTITDADGTFTGILTVTGGPGMTRINVQTHIEGSANDAVCALDLGIPQASEPSEPSVEERATEYYDADVVWSSTFVAVTLTPSNSGTFVRINGRNSRRWEGSFTTIPEEINLTNTDVGPGCNPTGVNRVRIDSVSPAGVALTYFDQNGVSTSTTLPPAPIPPEPAIVGACGGVLP